MGENGHLAELLERYDGNRVLVAAAYNAGSHRVDRWLRERPARPCQCIRIVALAYASNGDHGFSPICLRIERAVAQSAKQLLDCGVGVDRAVAHVVDQFSQRGFVHPTIVAVISSRYRARREMTRRGFSGCDRPRCSEQSPCEERRRAR